MDQNCVFCKIIAGQIPAAKIYQDDKVLAFLDINPVNKGHVLVIPKQHYSMMTDTPNDLIADIFQKSKKLMLVIKEAVQADFVVVSIVGVEVPHFHVHLVPRYHNDGLAEWWPTKKYDDGEMEKYAEKIKKFLNSNF
jgi:histidine triad (HIT) family protein